MKDHLLKYHIFPSGRSNNHRVTIRSDAEASRYQKHTINDGIQFTRRSTHAD